MVSLTELRREDAIIVVDQHSIMIGIPVIGNTYTTLRMNAKRLRGNAILDADCDDACTEEENALALPQSRTALTGVFLLAG